MKTQVVCIEGIHGVGKSTLKEYIKKETSYPTVDEGFVNLCDILGITEFEERCDHMAIREAVWMCNWAVQISKVVNEYDKTIGTSDEKERPKYIFCDRSPFSAFIYGKRNYGVNFKGYKINLDYALLTLAADTISEVEQQCNVDVHIVCLTLPAIEGFHRVQERLKVEPGRMKFNEDSWQHYVDCLYRYQFLISEFKFPTFNVSEMSTPAVFMLLMSHLVDKKSKKGEDNKELLMRYLFACPPEPEVK